MAAASPPSKRAKTTDSSSTSNSSPYELLYWPGIPGRGEMVRLLFEATSTPYSNLTTNPSGQGPPTVVPLIAPRPDNLGTDTAPPPLAPPILRHGDLIISQTPNICLYLAPRLDLAGDTASDPDAIYKINALALTALDGFSNEAHDTHHPIAIALHYEDQKEEALRRSKDYIASRLPKYLEYFERVLSGPASKGGEWLYGGSLTWADLVLWQGLNGVSYAFPKAIADLKGGGQYDKVWALYERVQKIKGIEEYLASDRRLKYGLGIWRHYPELDSTTVKAKE